MGQPQGPAPSGQSGPYATPGQPASFPAQGQPGTYPMAGGYAGQGPATFRAGQPGGHPQGPASYPTQGQPGGYPPPAYPGQGQAGGHPGQGVPPGYPSPAQPGQAQPAGSGPLYGRAAPAGQNPGSTMTPGAPTQPYQPYQPGGAQQYGGGQHAGRPAPGQPQPGGFGPDHGRPKHDHHGEHHHDHDDYDNDEYDDDEFDEDDEGARPAGHGHGHSHDAELKTSRRAAMIVRWLLIPCVVATAAAVFLMWPGHPHLGNTNNQATGSSAQRGSGEVRQITEQACPAGAQANGPKLPCGRALVHVTAGPGTGQDVSMDLPQGPGAPTLAVGDKVVLSAQDDGTGKLSYSIADKERGRGLLLMLGLCALLVIAVGRWQGIAALVALGASFAGLLLFVIPAVLNGQSPLPVALVGAAAIMFVLLYMTHGFSMQTSVAVLGTLVSLILTGVLGMLFTITTALTGYGSEESLYLSILNSNVDMRGLLLAGMIIGALGVLNDVTITQASTIAELAPTAKSRGALFAAGMRVGRAHIASAVNTIILAYAGESLPLLLLITASNQSLSDLLTGQFLAQEIVRSAVGTLGLVAAVPITTGLAALVVQVRPAPARRRLATARAR